MTMTQEDKDFVNTNWEDWIMGDICGDNRFIIIERAKEDILQSTNIESSKDEMKVLDDFLFRCWQMGWLDKYDK